MLSKQGTVSAVLFGLNTLANTHGPAIVIATIAAGIARHR